MFKAIVISVLFLGIGIVAPAATVLGQQMATPGQTIRGSIVALDLRAQPPTLRLTDEQGRQITLALDRNSTQVMDDNRKVRLEELKIGQQVQIESATQEGRQIARTIEVIDEKNQTPAASESKSPVQMQDEPSRPAGQPLY